jgi:hypothetical protein
MSVYQVFRSFHQKGEPYIYTESVATFDNLETVNMFLEEEKCEKSYYRHLETYVVEIELNKVYSNTMQNKKVLSKRF